MSCGKKVTSISMKPAMLKKQRQYLDERLSKRHEELKACFEEDRHALD